MDQFNIDNFFSFIHGIISISFLWDSGTPLQQILQTFSYQEFTVIRFFLFSFESIPYLYDIFFNLKDMFHPTVVAQLWIFCFITITADRSVYTRANSGGIDCQQACEAEGGMLPRIQCQKVADCKAKKKKKPTTMPSRFKNGRRGGSIAEFPLPLGWRTQLRLCLYGWVDVYICEPVWHVP